MHRYAQSPESAANRAVAQTEKEIDNVMTAIKQGIITATTKEVLLKLEHDKETVEISIAKAKMERPVLSREQIHFWMSRFLTIDIGNMEQKQRLIDVFLCADVYDDKTLIVLNYKDGEICVTFDEIQETLSKKENSGNHKDSRSSPLKMSGDPPSLKSEPSAASISAREIVSVPSL